MSRPEEDLLNDLPDPFAEALARPLPAPPAAAALPPAKTRDAVGRLRLAALLAAISYEGLLLAITGLRSDLGAAPRAALALLVVSPLIAGGLALYAASRTSSGASVPARVAGWTALAASIFAAGAVVAEGSGHAGHAASVWPCVLMTLLLGAGPLALGLFAFRGAFATGAPARSAALGVACGALAASTLALECAGGGFTHLLVGHGAGMAAGGLAGLALSRSQRA